MRVLLSGSAPYGPRAEKVSPYLLTHIDLAASAIIEETLLAGAMLRFGGHPSISRLVLDIANRLRRGPQVELFQSNHFALDFTDEAKELVARRGARLTETAKVIDDDPAVALQKSVAVMREAMMSNGVIDAVFFVGGMDGLIAEWDLVQQLSPRPAVFVMHQPGGQARKLVKNSEGGPLPHDTLVLQGSAYPELVADALASLRARR